MSIENTISESFSPDHTQRRLVLACNAALGGDIISPIFKADRDKKVVASLYNSGTNNLTKVALIGSTDPSMSHYNELTTDKNFTTLAPGEDGQVWMEPQAAYFALYAEGDGPLDVVLDIEERYAVPNL